MLIEFIEHTHARLDRRIDEIAASLAAGAAASYETYCGHCGRVRGLKEAKVILDEVLTEIRDDDDT